MSSKKSFSTACYLLERTNATSLYRSELEGIFPTLVDIEQKKLTPSEVVHWCDNEHAVIASSAPPVSGKSQMGADADIVMAIHAQRQCLPFPVSVKHVYGHQYGRNEGESKMAKDKQEKPRADPTKCPPIDIDNGLKAQFGLGTTPTTADEEAPEQTLQSRDVQINIACNKVASGTSNTVLKGRHSTRGTNVDIAILM